MFIHARLLYVFVFVHAQAEGIERGFVPSKGRFTHSMPFPCRAHAVPLPCRAAKGFECLSYLIYTVRPCLISHFYESDTAALCK
jgi:hypothetical protein